MRDVLRTLVERLETGGEALVCQVVETKGSTPQKAGALMLVSPDGGQVGTLGGGCVENEVKQKAIRLLGANRGAELHAFVLDHDYAWADGLICGGKMVVLAESLRGDGPLRYYRSYRDRIECGAGVTETVLIDPERYGPGRVGARFLFDVEGKLVAEWPSDAVPPEGLERKLSSLDERPKKATREGIAYIPTLPRIRLVVVGAGHVGRAVAELAAQADFDVWIVDDRRQYCNRERFPSAAGLIVGPIEEMLSRLEITSRTYAVIVTRGHGHDQEALHLLAPTPAAYVGLIGSRRKIRMIVDELRRVGVPEAALARVAAPIGFDIGSETVPEIAVSIVAELIARRNRGPEAVAPRIGLER